MRLQTDEQVDAMSKDEAIKFLVLQRNHHIVMWHDHGTILGKGYIFITVKSFMTPLYSFERMSIHRTSLLDCRVPLKNQKFMSLGLRVHSMKIEQLLFQRGCHA